MTPGREGFADLRNAFSRGPPVVVQFTVVVIRPFSPYLKKILVFVSLTYNTRIFHCTSRVYKLSEPTGSDWRHTSDKIMSLYIDSRFQITLLLAESACWDFRRHYKNRKISTCNTE